MSKSEGYKKIEALLSGGASQNKSSSPAPAATPAASQATTRQKSEGYKSIEAQLSAGAQSLGRRNGERMLSADWDNWKAYSDYYREIQQKRPEAEEYLQGLVAQGYYPYSSHFQEVADTYGISTSRLGQIVNQTRSAVLDERAQKQAQLDSLVSEYRNLGNPNYLHSAKERNQYMARHDDLLGQIRALEADLGQAPQDYTFRDRSASVLGGATKSTASSVSNFVGTKVAGLREAALALDPWFVPVDHAIIGLVDSLKAPDWKGPVPQ